MNLVIATHNQGKISEVKKILGRNKFRILSLTDYNISDQVNETGKSTKANAYLKAAAAAKKSKQWSIADDTSFSIHALNGAPGIYASRWAGPRFNREHLADYTLKKLKHLSAGKRQAHFQTTVCICSPSLKCKFFTGRISGHIALAKKGKAKLNLPYDSIFVPNSFHNTFAEMSEQQKNRISHRAQALKKAKKYLDSIRIRITEQQK